uniref:Palmitoyltransferase n=1 Tax=Glossina morsitans morsitans TaxID=37546 RepID=A0A1B0GC81_GLOMM
MNRKCLRKNLMPKTLTDACCVLFIFTFIPLTFIFEMCVVLPAFHEAGSFMFILTWLLGTFLLFNIVGNFIFCILEDTSIKSIMLTPPIEVELRRYWRLCIKCEILTPPRSWHCESCNTCILKRDHHCVFTGCCVGHRNQRYFLMFIVHIILGTFYALCYNSAYFWWLHKETYLDLGTAVKMICPLMTFLAEFSWTNIYLAIYEINVIVLIYTGVLLFFHGSNILKGAVSYERQTAKYDMGWRKNLIMVMGNRWHLVWFSPFLDSKLPHDGVHWEKLLQTSTKNR